MPVEEDPHYIRLVIVLAGTAQPASVMKWTYGISFHHAKTSFALKREMDLFNRFAARC
jgi:hypothetical protein